MIQLIKQLMMIKILMMKIYGINNIIKDILVY
jgi:hypothetical protein